MNLGDVAPGALSIWGRNSDGDTFAYLTAAVVIWAAALPLSARLFRRFPDAGAGLAFPLGSVLVSAIYFLLRTASIVEPGRAGCFIAVALLVLVGCWALGSNPRVKRDILRRARPIAVVLILFIGAFAAFAMFRSYLPDIAGTEQPMDLLYLNAAISSPTYPPEDPWLAGERASYYYLGYVQAGVLTQLAGAPASSGYNLALAWFFGASAAAAWSVALAVGRGAFAGDRRHWPVAGAALAVVLLLGAGSLMGAFEWAAAHEHYDSGLYRVFDAESVLPCSQNPADQVENCYRGSSPRTTEWYPTEFWFWFDDTRTIPGTITEFPAFSFLLGDLHPHVMAIPLVLLAVGLSFARWRSRRPAYFRELRRDPASALVTAVILGSLAFQNAWDLITFSGLFALAASARAFRDRPRAADWAAAGIIDLRRAIPVVAAALPFAAATLLVSVLLVALGFPARQTGLLAAACLAAAVVAGWTLAKRRGAEHSEPAPRGGDTADVLLGIAIVGSYLVPIFALAFLIFLPWVLTFGSQAAGFYAYVGDGTRPAHAFLQFGPVAVPALGLLVSAGVRPWPISGRALAVALAVPGAPLLIWLAVAMARGTANAGLEARSTGGGWVTLAAYSLFVGMFAGSVVRAAGSRKGTGPVLLLGGLGILLLLGTELFFIRDVFFGSLPRMNTVFKLSYEAWLLLAIAGGVGLAGTLRAATSNRALLAPAAALVAVVVLIGSLVFPLIAVPNRTDGFAGPRSIDGFDGLARHEPDEYALAQWVSATVAPGTVVLEATGRRWGAGSDGRPVLVENAGGDYSEAGRVSSRTGSASPIAWYFHEVQWRGSGVRAELDRRQSLVDTVYTSRDATAALVAMRDLNAEYVVVGRLEKSLYPDEVITRFETFLDLAWEQGATRVYRLPPYELVPTS